MEIHRVKTKQTERASWYLAGFKSKEELYQGKGFIYSKLGSRYSKVFEGEPGTVKPALAKQFLDMHPGLNGYTSTGWVNYLNLREKSPYANDVLGSFRSALDLFKAQYGYVAEWVLVFTVAK